MIVSIYYRYNKYKYSGTLGYNIHILADSLLVSPLCLDHGGTYHDWQQRIYQPLLSSVAKREHPGFLQTTDDNDTWHDFNRWNGEA